MVWSRTGCHAAVLRDPSKLCIPEPLGSRRTAAIATSLHPGIRCFRLSSEIGLSSGRAVPGHGTWYPSSASVQLLEEQLTSVSDGVVSTFNWTFWCDSVNCLFLRSVSPASSKLCAVTSGETRSDSTHLPTRQALTFVLKVFAVRSGGRVILSTVLVTFE